MNMINFVFKVYPELSRFHTFWLAGWPCGVAWWVGDYLKAQALAMTEAELVQNYKVVEIHKERNYVVHS